MWLLPLPSSSSSFFRLWHIFSRMILLFLRTSILFLRITVFFCLLSMLFSFFFFSLCSLKCISVTIWLNKWHSCYWFWKDSERDPGIHQPSSTMKRCASSVRRERWEVRCFKTKTLLIHANLGNRLNDRFVSNTTRISPVWNASNVPYSRRQTEFWTRPRNCLRIYEKSTKNSITFKQTDGVCRLSLFVCCVEFRRHMIIHFRIFSQCISNLILPFIAWKCAANQLSF